jgi:PBP1b-binding outer membrane lipoprotein LpoB
MDFCILSQSNLISPYKGTYSVTAFVLFSALFLASCTSAPKKSVVTVPAIESNIIDPKVDMTITAEETIALASDANPTEAKNSLSKRLSYILNKNITVKLCGLLINYYL